MTIKRRQARLVAKYLRNGKIAIYLRGRKIHQVYDGASYTAFVTGFYEARR